MTSVDKYQVYCTTESKFYTIWSESEPTVCPNNSGHSINTAATSIIDTVSNNDVKILEEEPPLNYPSTGGHYASTCVILDVPAATIAGEITTATKAFAYATGLIDVHFTTTADMEGDILHADMGLDTIVGVISNDVDIGTTGVEIGVTVSSTVIENVAIGYNIRLFDGVNQDECCHIVSIDTENSTINLEQGPLNYSFSASSPTYVQATIEMLQDFTLGQAQTYRLGMNTVGSSYVPAGTVGHFRYENWDMSAKKLYVYLEFFY
jgi:hypothetical protein